MRLIDADELIKYIKTWEIGTSISSDQKEFINCVNEQPTAFDVDKVVKQLDKASDYYEFDEQGKERVQMINLTEAIEIVKGGGVDD